MWKDRLAYISLIHRLQKAGHTFPKYDRHCVATRPSMNKEKVLFVCQIAVSDFFEFKMISDIFPFQWYRSIIAMSKSSATTITRLCFRRRKTDCYWNNWWVSSPITLDHYLVVFLQVFRDKWNNSWNWYCWLASSSVNLRLEFLCIYSTSSDCLKFLR